jgi:hypothetical protein
VAAESEDLRNRFELRDYIGEGTYAKVYTAWDLATETMVRSTLCAKSVEGTIHNH